MGKGIFFLAFTAVLICGVSSAQADELDDLLDYLVQTRQAELINQSDKNSSSRKTRTRRTTNAQTVQVYHLQLSELITVVQESDTTKRHEISKVEAVTPTK